MEIVIPRVNRKYYVPIGVGCVAAIFLLYLALQNSTNSPEGVFARYTKLQRIQDYKKAYKTCFSHGYRKRIKFPAFEKLQKDSTAMLGFTIDKEIIEKKRFKTKKGPGIYAIAATGFYPSGVVPENYFFIKGFRGWRIDTFDMQSPLLDPAGRKREKAFFDKLPPDQKEPYKRMLKSQGRSLE